MYKKEEKDFPILFRTKITACNFKTKFKLPGHNLESLK